MSEPTPALYQALFDAQLAVKPTPKRSEMDAGKFGYMYAASGDVVRYSRSLLHANGLAVIITGTVTRPGEGARGVVCLSGVLFHRHSGETMPVSFELPYVGSKGRPDDKASQASISTGEARMYRLLLGLTTADEEDEVANAQPDHAEARQAPATPAAKTPPKAPEPKVAPAPTPKAKVEPPKPKPEPPAKPAASSSPEEIEARGDLAKEEEAGYTPATAEEIEAFETIAKRLGLDTDTATTWASREPFERDGGGLSRMKDDPAARVVNFNDAKKHGELAKLLPRLEREIADLKARKIHPRQSGWADHVKTWSANQLGF